MTERAIPADRSASTWSITLLGGFAASYYEKPVTLTPGVRRVVAFLALQLRRVTRSYLAGSLWTDDSEARALASLRSALWRLRSSAEDLVVADHDSVGLSDSVSVDLELAVNAAERISIARHGDQPLDTVDPFTKELLPGWSDEWALVERERHRQRSLHALESMAGQLVDCGQHAKAIDLALIAIQMDPLRESAHRALIEAHVAEGNYSEAIRCHNRYRQLIESELGITPSPLLGSSVITTVN